MSVTQRRLYLLDASTYIFRAFHSTNPKRGGFAQSLSTSSGMPTNAILVFTNMLKKLVREHAPTHFAAVFDPPKGGPKNFRYETFSEYKANRKPTPEDLLVQFPYFRPVCEGLGLTVIEKGGFEADDVIATLAAKSAADGWDTVIVSSDKDLYQILRDGVRMYDGMKDRWIDLAMVHKKFGVDPDKVLQVQALIGDSIDNIPGVPGVGPKTAAKLVDQYGDLEGIYANIEAVKGKLKERLIDNREGAFLSRDLAHLRENVDVSCDFDAWAIREPNLETLLPIFHELEFKALVREYQTASRPKREIERHLVSSWADLRALTASLSKSERFSIDLIRDRSEYVQAAVVGLAFATDDDKSWYVPLNHRYLGAPDQLPIDSVLGELSPYLTSAPDRRQAHGHKELSVVLARAGVKMNSVGLDTELASYLVDATKYEHSLENIALNELETKLPEPPPAVAKGRESWAQTPVDIAADYTQSRVEAVQAIAGQLRTDMEEAELTKLNSGLELPLARLLADMEVAGVRVDPTVLRELSTEFGNKATALERECHEHAGAPFNLGSPKQLADVLFNRLGLPVIKKTKTGASTDASVLDQLADKHPIVNSVLAWRSISKLKGTYTDVLPTLINPETGRIHTNFRQSVAATGRLSSFEPNLQNIPIRTEEGRRIRDAFVPAPGCLLMSADYSQIELRVLAHLSADEGLVEAFREHTDIHQKTAGEVFGVPTQEVTFEQRSAAKAINFGLMYGMGAFRLARDLHITRAEAEDYIARYFARYASVKAYMDGTIEFGRKHGWVQTILGRRRYVPELRSRNFQRRAGAERAAINTPVQGSAADLIKLAMLSVDKQLKARGMATRMVLQVHDELVFDVPEAEIDAAQALVVQCMEQVYELKVPLTVGVAVGHNWNEAH